MRIKIISPTSIDPSNQLIKLRRATAPPLSIFHLAGLTPREHEVEVVDDTVQEPGFEDSVDLVALTSTTSAIKRAYQIAGEFRRRKVKVVMGGIHATMLPDEALEHADSVVLGEAEDVWPQVIADSQQGTLQRIYRGARRESLENLPFPRFDLLDHSKYIRLPFRKSPIIPIQTARGCPHLCDFCSVSKFWGRRMRFRPVDNVVAEIRASGADIFFFTDDNFVANPRRTLELAEALTPLNIRYICQIDSLAHRQPEVIRAIAQSGCFLAFVGFESLSVKTLNNANKVFNDPTHYADLIGILHKHGINVYASFIMGFEQDNLESARATVDFLIEQKVSLASFFRLTPYPGTGVYDRLARDGFLPDKTWWLKRGEGVPNVVLYPQNPHTGEELSSLSMRRFFSWSSILKRFFPFPPFKIPLLGLNWYTHQKVMRFNKNTIL
jgi:radical SAM superfamily enzyme YgiQ (UPF0313 family)